VREESVTAGEIDDTTAAKEAAHTSSRLPRFVEFFSRQASGLAHRATDAIEQRVAGKSVDVVQREPALRRCGKRSGRVYHAVNT